MTIMTSYKLSKMVGFFMA